MLFFIFSREGMSEPKEKTIGTYIESMREGMIRGGLSSLIVGGYEGMIGNIVSQGIVNPIVKFIE